MPANEIDSRTECSRKSCDLLMHRRGLCHQHYDSWRRTRPTGKVPIGPVRDHLWKLIDAGMTRDKIAEKARVSRATTIHGILDPEREFVRALTAAKILSVPVPEIHDPGADIARLVPAIGIQRRLQALVANGYEQLYLARRLNVVWQTVSLTINGNRDSVRVDFARAVHELFCELEVVPGGNRRATLWAQRRGWHPPFAWDHDTIDDPAAEPSLPEARTDWFDSFLELREMGIPPRLAAKRVGVPWENVAQRLRRIEKRVA